MTRLTLDGRLHLLIALLALVAMSLLVAPLAEAKRKDERGNDNGKGGIPAVLAKLDALQDQVAQNAKQMARLQEQVAELDANVTPCTLERFRNGQCGADNHPLDLLVSVCGGVGANAGLALKYAFTSNLDVQVGIGWKDAPDVHIVENAQLPAILTPPPLFLPVVLPSELAAQVDARAGLGLDGCVGPIRVPIGKELSEPVVLAILEQLEATAAPIRDRLTDQMGGGGVAAAGLSDPGMNLAVLANALDATDSLRDDEIAEENSMAAFGRGPIANLAGTLPVGNRLTTIIADPEQLALPGMSAAGSRARDNFGPADIFFNVCGGGTASTRLAPLCDFIGERLPSVDRLLNLVEVIEMIPGQASEIVDGVRALLAPIFMDIGETAENTLTRFCNSSVGQRRIFDLLCGR